MRAVAAGVAAMALAAAGAGCLDGRSSSSSVLRHGRAIYTRFCSSCHTLVGREEGARGGDLAVGHLAVADLISFARTMPVRPPLSPTEAEAVARYVHAAEERAREQDATRGEMHPTARLPLALVELELIRLDDPLPASARP